MANLLVLHGGGPTAVINASLYGVITEAKKQPGIGRILGAIGGTGGLLARQFIDLGAIEEEELRLLPYSPGSAIGTSRDHLEEADYDAMLPIFREMDVDCVLLNGGNGTMDTCGKIYAHCAAQGIRVIGIPKTMDNDIAVTDHAPGFGSAARYLAQSVAEVCADVNSLPIHVVVVEASGRNAGWIAAASALAARSGSGPDLIYLPERDFDEAAFLSDVERLIALKKGVVVVASEGLHTAGGVPIVEPVLQVGRATYFGDVGAHLANLVIQKLGYKARSEKPGLLGRASVGLVSPLDREEAVLAGGEAVRAALRGESGKMVGFCRTGGAPYRAELVLIDIAEVMLHEKRLPDHFINAEGNGVTPEFIRWCEPLLGEPPLPRLVSFLRRGRITPPSAEFERKGGLIL